MPVDKRKAVAGILSKLKGALEAMKSRVPKGKLPSLEALRVYINKMKPKDPNAPRKINYHGGVFKLAKLGGTTWNPPRKTSFVPDQLRIKEAWEKGVKGAHRRER
jgi:hypothetical protein